MPDAIANHHPRGEDQDVLLSLRRLVARRPERRSMAPLELTAAQRGNPAANSAAPLVLSAAQRVRPAMTRRAGAPPPRAMNVAEMDDTALRALVASAVRDELRGEVGAHLTRRLRRLVREEIALALETQKLER